jgi:proline racemase
MRAARMFSAIDSHTEGMPTRVVTGGVGALPGDTMFERKQYLETRLDDVRQLLMYEPRGHSAMSGAILQPSSRPDADWGVLFIEVSGCLPMCGHGAMGVATVLVEAGMVSVTTPVTSVRLDTPAGLVVADVAIEDGHASDVTLTNVPSFVLDRGLTVDVEGLGTIAYDVAFGGNFYPIVAATSLGLELELHHLPELIRRAMGLMESVNSSAPPVHPQNDQINVCHHVLITGPGRDGSSARNTVVVNPGWIDRSPCGTGTSARMAHLHALGDLSLDEPFIHESILGTRFVGRLTGSTRVGPYEAVIPTITGRAWITGTAQYMLDPSDPFPAGFLVPVA